LGTCPEYSDHYTQPGQIVNPWPRHCCGKAGQTKTSDFSTAGANARSGENLPATRAWRLGCKNRKSVSRDNTTDPGLRFTPQEEASGVAEVFRQAPPGIGVHGLAP